MVHGAVFVVVVLLLLLLLFIVPVSESKHEQCGEISVTVE